MSETPTTIKIEICLSLTPALLALLRQLGVVSVAAPGGDVTAPAPEPTGMRVDWVTPERLDRLRSLAAEGRWWSTIDTELSRLPGPLLSRGAVKSYAKRHGIKRSLSDAERTAKEISAAKMRAMRAAKSSQSAARPPIEPAVEAVAIPVVPGAEPHPIAPQPKNRGDVMQTISRAIDARIRRIATADDHAVLADLAQVRAWAAQRGIAVQTWDDLPAVNRKRDALGLPRFVRTYPQSAIRRA